MKKAGRHWKHTRSPRAKVLVVALGFGMLLVPAGGSVAAGPGSIPPQVHGAEGGAGAAPSLRPAAVPGHNAESSPEVTVPGHYSNFKEAIDKYDPGQEVGTIVVQPGEHRWENFLEIGHTVNVRGGSENALLPVRMRPARLPRDIASSRVSASRVVALQRRRTTRWSSIQSAPCAGLNAVISCCHATCRGHCG